MTLSLPPLGWNERQHVALGDDLIEAINRMVNHAIDHDPNPPVLAAPWRVVPKVGWCTDYAYSKYWLLRTLGYQGAMRFVECEMPDGQHHLVLEVASVGYLDSLTDVIVDKLRYRILRHSDFKNPNVWSDDNG